MHVIVAAIVTKMRIHPVTVIANAAQSVIVRVTAKSVLVK